MRLRRVDLAKQEASLRPALVAVHVAGHGDPRLKDLLSILTRSLQQLPKVLVLGLLMILLLAPGRDGFSVKDEDVEERIQKKDTIGCNTNSEKHVSAIGEGKK